MIASEADVALILPMDETANAMAAATAVMEAAYKTARRGRQVLPLRAGVNGTLAASCKSDMDGAARHLPGLNAWRSPFQYVWKFSPGRIHTLDRLIDFAWPSI